MPHITDPLFYSEDPTMFSGDVFGVGDEGAAALEIAGRTLHDVGYAVDFGSLELGLPHEIRNSRDQLVCVTRCRDAIRAFKRGPFKVGEL